MTSSGKLRLERQYKGDAAHGTVGQEGAGVTETVEFQWFLGVDWGSAAHVLCLVDAQGHVRGRRTVAHTAAAVHDAVQWIGEQTGVTPEAIAIGIESRVLCLCAESEAAGSISRSFYGRGRQR